MQSSLSMKVAMFKIPFNQGKLLGNVPWLIQSVLAYSCSTETFLYTTFHLFRWANKLSSQRFLQDCLNKCSLLVWGLPSIYLKYVIPFWCLFHFFKLSCNFLLKGEYGLVGKKDFSNVLVRWGEPFRDVSGRWGEAFGDVSGRWGGRWSMLQFYD